MMKKIRRQLLLNDPADREFVKRCKTKRKTLIADDFNDANANGNDENANDINIAQDDLDLRIDMDKVLFQFF